MAEVEVAGTLWAAVVATRSAAVVADSVDVALRAVDAASMVAEATVMDTGMDATASGSV
jgi:hypothetical protein